MVKKITISLLLGAVIVGASVWSYDRGLGVNNAFEAIKLMAVVQFQKRCIDESDQKCTLETNRALASMVAGQLRRSDLDSLSASDREAVEAFMREVESTK